MAMLFNTLNNRDNRADNPINDHFNEKHPNKYKWSIEHAKTAQSYWIEATD